MARIFAQVHQTVLGHRPGDLIEVDDDDEVVGPYLASKALTKVRPGDVEEVLDQAPIDPTGPIPDVDLAAFDVKGDVEAFAREYGVDLTGAKTRADMERMVAEERARRAESAGVDTEVGTDGGEAPGDTTGE